MLIAVFATATSIGAMPTKSDHKAVVKHDRQASIHHINHQDNRNSIKPLDDNDQENHEKHGAHDYYAYPKYEFEYGVKDPHTGDHKTHWEVRDGDVVKGEYTVAEADGSTRIVKYSSDGQNGFQAVVEKIGKAEHRQ